MYNSTFPSTSALDGVGVQHHALTALPPGKATYPLYLRLGGPQGRSGRVWKIPPPGFDPRPVQPVCAITTPKISCNIILPYTPRVFPPVSFMHVSSPSYTPRAPPIALSLAEDIISCGSKPARYVQYQVFVGQAVWLPAESRARREQCSVMRLWHEMAIRNWRRDGFSPPCICV